MRRLRVALLALALTACGSGEPIATSSLPIFGGALDTNDAAVVAVVNFAGGQCSGSLIAPTLVLTARHCVADTDKELKVVCGQTTFKPPDSAGAIFVVPLPQISEDPKDYLAVSEIRVPDGLGDDLCGTDVVLLRLKLPLPGITPLSPRVDEPVAADETYSAVGFGLDEALADKPSGERKRLDDLKIGCAGSECRDPDVRDNEWVGSRGSCPGDSGGPALDAEGRIIGVVSRGSSGCENPIYSDVATRADWLGAEATAAATAAHETPPTWAPAPAPNGGPAATCGFSPVCPRPASLWLASLCGVLAVLRRRKVTCGRHLPRVSRHSSK